MGCSSGHKYISSGLLTVAIVCGIVGVVEVDINYLLDNVVNVWYSGGYDVE